MIDPAAAFLVLVYWLSTHREYRCPQPAVDAAAALIRSDTASGKPWSTQGELQMAYRVCSRRKK